MRFFYKQISELNVSFKQQEKIVIFQYYYQHVVVLNKLMLSLEKAEYHPNEHLTRLENNPITLFLRHKDPHCHHMYPNGYG